MACQQVDAADQLKSMGSGGSGIGGPWRGVASLEGDGWVDWSGLATLVANIGHAVSNRLECLLGLSGVQRPSD